MLFLIQIMIKLCRMFLFLMKYLYVKSFWAQNSFGYLMIEVRESFEKKKNLPRMEEGMVIELF